MEQLSRLKFLSADTGSTGPPRQEHMVAVTKAGTAHIFNARVFRNALVSLTFDDILIRSSFVTETSYCVRSPISLSRPGSSEKPRDELQVKVLFNFSSSLSTVQRSNQSPARIRLPRTASGRVGANQR